MRPMTDFRPKTLVKLNERPILDYIVEALPDAVDELVLVVGYRGEQVHEHCGEMFMGRKVTYVEQENPVAGTANALAVARDVLNDKFLVLMGDDLYGKAGLTRAIGHDLCVIGAESDEPEKFGVIVQNAQGFLVDIIEKPEKPETNVVSTGAMVLDMRIFNYHTEPDPRTGEEYLPDMVKQLANDYPVYVETLKKWYPIGYPGDVVVVERVLKEVSLVE